MSAVPVRVVPIDAVTPDPGNPRQGDVDAIAGSLRVNGQYRPIVADGRTGEIIAGNHTWKAAKRLGWATIAVTFLDVEPQHAAAIGLDDNRLSDLARTDDARALALMEALPDLDGTTYTQADAALMALPLGGLDDPDAEPPPGAVDGGGGDARETAGIPVQVGKHRFQITDEAYGRLRITLPKRNGDAIAEVCRRLGLLEPPLPQGATEIVFTDPEVVGIETLLAYPGNPREGDVPAIAASLIAHGQYRPVVVSRRTGRVLVGNHTVAAAVSLGWRQIGATYVDVDEDGERRIVLADNHSSDMATYDQEALERRVLAVAGYGLIGSTAWDLADLDAPLVPGTPDRDATVRLGTLRTRVRVSLVRRADLDPSKIISRLGLSADDLVEHLFD